MGRVLRPGGEAHVAPVWISDSMIETFCNDQMMQEYFGSLGVTMNIRPISSEAVPFRRRIDASLIRRELTPAPYDVTLTKE